MRHSDIAVTDNESLIRAVRDAYASFRGQVWWRGHRRSEWRLVPRIFDVRGGFNFEQNAIARFRQRAISRHIKLPEENDYSAWLFLMQHYRLPTRLLDWTESPLIGAYFAALPPEIPSDLQNPPPSDGALYALSPYLLNLNQLSIDGLVGPYDPRITNAVRRAFDSNAPDADYVAAILPFEVDVRMMTQQSVFTIHASGRAIEDLAASDTFVVRYLIPAASKAGLLSQLKQLGLKESTVFPDLEHLAHEVRELTFASPRQPRRDVGWSPFDSGALDGTDPLSST